MQKQFIKGLVTKISEGKYRVLASTSAIDRQGDSIDQSGWDISNFKLNPVMPWAHNYDELPVAKALSIEITKRGLECDFEFAPAEGNPKAQQVKVLYDQGYLNAVSVGFIPKERKGNTITKAELLEISFVPVPANQEALRLAFESKSLDISTIEADIKGAVEDELTAEEMWEKKCEKLDEVMEVISAFWKVYFDEATPVENFKPLLIETIALLQTVADNDGIDDAETATGEEGADTTGNETSQAGLVGKAISPEATKSFNEFVIKEGRTLSKKTLEIINSAIESMKGTTSVLEELKAASSEEQDAKSSDSTTIVEKALEAAGEEGVITLKIEELPIIRQALVAKDKTNELALSIVNNYIKSVGKK